MKENRFIELLNLYIDRQITAEETAELEAEIQANPKRQAVYRQYCQIHSATKLVYESFRAVATEQPAAPTGRPGVVELFETRRRRRNWAAYTVGFAAAAACLAIVFVRQGSSQPAAAEVAVAKPRPAVVVAAATPVAPAVVAPTVATDPELANLRNAIVKVSPEYTAMLAALREQDEERAFHNERLQLNGMKPLFTDDLFEAGRVLNAQEQRIFRSEPATSKAQVEAAAFQFSRQRCRLRPALPLHATQPSAFLIKASVVALGPSATQAWRTALSASAAL
jgi:anti-sigma factor RsiW